MYAIRSYYESGTAHTHVNEYLSKHFSREYVDQYSKIFDEYLNEYHKGTLSHNKEEQLEQLQNNQKAITNICEQLNKELEKGEKISLFIQLLQFLRKESKIGGEELCLFDSLATSLLINKRNNFV